MQLGSAGVFYLGPQSKSPVGSGDASNGLSIDPISGDVVLGNDIGDTAAALTSVRVIPIPGFGIIFSDTPGLIETYFFAGFIQINTATSVTTINEDGYNLTRSVIGGRAEIALADSTRQVVFGMDSLGKFLWTSSAVGRFGAFDVANGKWQIGNGSTFNGAQLEVIGSVTSDLFINVTGGAIALNSTTDKGKLFTNEGGASTFTLPVSNSTTRGLHYMFACQQAVNLIVDAPVSDTINIGGVVSIAGGTATGNTTGTTCHLVAIGNNQWMAMSSQGTWVVV